jgi:hypothetical protein
MFLTVMERRFAMWQYVNGVSLGNLVKVSPVDLPADIYMFDSTLEKLRELFPKIRVRVEPVLVEHQLSELDLHHRFSWYPTEGGFNASLFMSGLYEPHVSDVHEWIRNNLFVQSEYVDHTIWHKTGLLK